MPDLDDSTGPVSRRTFILASVAAAGGLTVGIYAINNAGDAQSDSLSGQLNGWIHIAPDNIITITLAHAEMGQGIATALPIIMAEELEADWSQIRVAKVSTQPKYDDAVTAVHTTGGSRTLRSMFEPLSKAGAAAREMLRQAAADDWQVPLAECVAIKGTVRHDPSGRSLPYGALVEKAARLSPPQDVPLKTAGQHKLIGRPTNRLDTPEMIDGSMIYGIDVSLEGMLVGAVKANPVFGGHLNGVDLAPLRMKPGIQLVTKYDHWIIALADSFWQAKKALETFDVPWPAGPLGTPSTDDLKADLLAKMDGPGTVALAQGNVDDALASAAKTIEAIYELPLLHQATMEPMNATAWAKDGGVEIWVPTQSPGNLKAVVARQFKLPIEKVVVHMTAIGGGFGRRLETDYAMPAVHASMEAGRPVKIIWSREEDMAHSFYRPLSVSKFRAAIDEDGNPIAWDNYFAMPSAWVGFTPERMKAAIPRIALSGAQDMPYAIPNKRLKYTYTEIPVPIGAMRSVAHSHNGFYVEAFVNEIASATERDPVELRRTLLRDKPRHLAVLDKVAAESGWFTPAPPGRFRGVAVHESFGSIVAEVIELSLPERDRIKLEKVTAVIDCGVAVNPKTIETQIQGAIIYALTAAIYGEITVRDGAVEQTNFDNYRLLELRHIPPIEVHILESDRPIGGIGEPGVPPVFAALTYATSAAIGRPVRSLPLSRHGLSI